MICDDDLDTPPATNQTDLTPLPKKRKNSDPVIESSESEQWDTCVTTQTSVIPKLVESEVKRSLDQWLR